MSIMHERIRVPDLDFAESKLLVVQFGKGDEKKRVIRLFDSAEVDLFDIDELNEMTNETYRLWIQVLGERAEDARGRPTGTNPFGF